MATGAAVEEAGWVESEAVVRWVRVAATMVEAEAGGEPPWAHLVGTLAAAWAEGVEAAAPRALAMALQGQAGTAAMQPSLVLEPGRIRRT